MQEELTQTITSEKGEPPIGSGKLDTDPVILIDEPGLLFEYHFVNDHEKLNKAYADLFDAVYEQYGFQD